MTRWMWIAMVLALGCDKRKEDPGPSCEQVAEHVNEVATKAYPGHSEMLPKSSRKAYVESCKARKLTGKQRRCMLEAPSMEAIAMCVPRPKADEKSPGAAPRAAPAPAPTAPAPAAPAPAPAAP
jgi:hypothetical protein